MCVRYSFLFFLFFYIHAITPAEYTYPVASLDNGSTVLYIHQLSPDNIQLFEWNTVTNYTENILWSLFNPAALQLLPNNVGFSFIDGGRLRIKSFQKRSPKTIDFDEPIFNLNTIQWIDEHTCYCSAQQSDCFSIFQLHDNGILQCLVSEKNKDCMYPQKIENQLFYIERCKINNQYRIMQTNYLKNNEDKKQGVHAQLVANFKDKPIVFLHMHSKTEGFVLEHLKNIDSEGKTALFFYHHLVKKGDAWQNNLIISFTIPTDLFLQTSNQRLFESILPLLPRLIDNKIYFTDCSQNDNNTLEPYYYDLLTAQKHKIFVSSDQDHFFVPVLCGTKLYCGGTKRTAEKEPLTCLLT